MFEHILRHAEMEAWGKALGYPLLIFGMRIVEKQDLVTPNNILGPPTYALTISHKLHEGHHLKDGPSRKKARKLKEKVPDTIIESGRALASTSKSSTSRPKKLIRDLDRTIQSYESMLTHIFE